MSDDRLPALTGLRGFAALWVLVFHAWALAASASADLPAPIRAAMAAGWLGVDVFFVLSGFLLARSLAASQALSVQGGRDWAGYAVMRGARILPAYYAQLLVFAIPASAALLTPAIAWSPPSGAELAAHALLWLNAWPWVPAHLGPWWSLSVEAAFYLALPLLWWAWGSSHRMVVLMLSAALLSVAWRFVVQGQAIGIEQRIGWAEHLPGRGVQFIAGMAAAWLISRGGPTARWWPAAEGVRGVVGAGLALLAIIALAALPQFGGERSYAGVVDARPWTWAWPLLAALPVGVLLASLVLVPGSVVARALGSAPLRALGTISFSLYLWHYPVQWALRSALGGYVPEEFGFGAFLGVGLLLSVLVATLSWWAVERPALDAARLWRARRHARLTPP